MAIVYFLCISIAMCMSLNISLIVEAKSGMLLRHRFSRFLIPALACSHIKVFSCILTLFVYSRHLTTSSKSLNQRFSNRLKRMIFKFTLWLYSINSMLIIIFNPSLLNPGPQNLSVLYQNVQGFIPISQLNSVHPLLDLNKISEFHAYVNTSKPDIIDLNETWLKSLSQIMKFFLILNTKSSAMIVQEKLTLQIPKILINLGKMAEEFCLLSDRILT